MNLLRECPVCGTDDIDIRRLPDDWHECRDCGATWPGDRYIVTDEDEEAA